MKYGWQLLQRLSGSQVDGGREQTLQARERALREAEERVRRTEAVLRESEHRYRQLVELSPAALVIECEDEFVFVNGEAMRLFGATSADQLVGQPIMDRVHPAIRSFVDQRIRLVRGGDRAERLEQRLLRLDGTAFDAEVAGAPITFQGKPAILCVFYDVTVQKETERRVREQNRQLQQLSHRLVEVQENERHHMARELHDEIGQLLTGLHFLLERRRDEPLTQQRLDDAQGIVRELIGRVRDLSLDLRPVALDERGLVFAVRWHCERYFAQTGIAPILKQHGIEGRRFARDVETAAFRIIQEALTNVARHSGAEEVILRVWCDAQTLNVQVEDGGAGFVVEDVEVASGLSSMRQRASAVGGRLCIESAPGAGTRVTAELPA
jgi:PAS domain S-box-containing protein